MSNTVPFPSQDFTHIDLYKNKFPSLSLLAGTFDLAAQNRLVFSVEKQHFNLHKTQKPITNQFEKKLLFTLPIHKEKPLQAINFTKKFGQTNAIKIVKTILSPTELKNWGSQVHKQFVVFGIGCIVAGNIISSVITNILPDNGIIVGLAHILIFPVLFLWAAKKFLFRLVPFLPTDKRQSKMANSEIKEFKKWLNNLDQQDTRFLENPVEVFNKSLPICIVLGNHQELIQKFSHILPRLKWVENAQTTHHSKIAKSLESYINIASQSLKPNTKTIIKFEE